MTTGPGSVPGSPAFLYHAACLRWASGTGSTADAAAAGLLPLPPNALPPDYGLPVPPGQEEEYARLKNVARAESHKERSRRDADALDAALTAATLPSPSTPLDGSSSVARQITLASTGAMAIPASLGLGRAARFGLGMSTCVQWFVPRHALYGQHGLVSALSSDGWSASLDGDDPDTLIFSSSPGVSDARLVSIVRAVVADSGYASAQRSSIIPAGYAVASTMQRSKGARAFWMARLYWFVELAIRGTSMLHAVDDEMAAQQISHGLGDGRKRKRSRNIFGSNLLLPIKRSQRMT
jgi:hypothetical protein